MLEDSVVDAVDDCVCPHRPVRIRKHLEAVPRIAGEAGPAVCQRFKAKLTALRHHCPVQMRRVNIEGAQFTHRIGLCGDVEGEMYRFIPNSNRVDKVAGREFTVAPCPDTVPVNTRTRRI